jgi:Mycothiol maleylpyruvate isomerase N-terminal domain
VPADLDAFDLGENYGLSRQRLAGLVGDLMEDSRDPASIAVLACPGWSVHDVVAHLVSVAEDALAGKLTGPPTDEQTAEQVERKRATAMNRMLDEWAQMSPEIESGLNALRIWPGFLDILSHEHDVRAAVCRPAGRDSSEMTAASEYLLSFWRPPVEVAVSCGGYDHLVGPERRTDPELRLRTSPFEVFRFRLGRRSPGQLRRMEWSGDPSPVLDHMVIFGPEPYDLVE